jgi:hypothetical protein
MQGATYVMIDEGGAAKKVGSEFTRYGFVNHGAGDYVRGDIHINDADGYFSIFKLGIYGTYQHQPTAFEAVFAGTRFPVQ